MSDEDEKEVGLQVYTAEFVVEPMVGLTVYPVDGEEFWLSWEETCELARFLRQHVAA